jgi:hypothetical protein
MDQMNVRSNFLNSVQRRRTHSALAYLLLLAIGYGAIVEAAHTHGFPSSRSAQLTVVSDRSDSSSRQDRSNHNDCSLCQFQRQLFGGFAQVILIAVAPQQVTFLSKETVSYLSTSVIPTLGRAPPRS